LDEQAPKSKENPQVFYFGKALFWGYLFVLCLKQPQPN
jgi:hypothetical protein